MSGPVSINGSAPLDPPSGDDPAYLPLCERAFRARCEARWLLYESGDMTWEQTGFPDELMPVDWFDILDDLPSESSILEIAIGPVERLDNLLSRAGPEAERYPSIKALLIDLNDDEFKTLAHDLHSDRPDHAAWTCDEIKELAIIRRRYRHG